MRRIPKVFVITLNWNGKKWLSDCLSSVLAMHYPNFEVVVVDNGSTDGSVEFMKKKFPQVHVVETFRNLRKSILNRANLLAAEVDRASRCKLQIA